MVESQLEPPSLFIPLWWNRDRGRQEDRVQGGSLFIPLRWNRNVFGESEDTWVVIFSSHYDGIRDR